MKTILHTTFLVLLLAAGITSCKQDDAPGIVPIEGRWEIAQEGEVVNGVEFLEAHENTAGCTKDYTEFIIGGIVRSHYFETSPSTTCDEFTDNGTFVRTGNLLTVTFGNQPASVAEIVIITPNVLKLKFTDEDGVYVTVFTR